MSKYDFHLHSKYSDGYWNIDGILENAKSHGLLGLALTDHDNVIGSEEFIEKATKSGFKTTTGVEITTTLPDETRLDILGYGFDLKNEELLAELRNNRSAKEDRDAQLLAKLKELGFVLDDQKIAEEKEKAKGYLGRVKIARFILDNEENKRLIKDFSWDGVWNEYLGKGGKAFVGHFQIDSDKAIKLIHNAGGLASLAHPGESLNDRNKFESVMEFLIKTGLDGLEVYSWKHKDEESQYFRRFADKNNLIITFGSDDHGWPQTKRTMGQVFVEDEEDLAEKFFLALKK